MNKIILNKLNLKTITEQDVFDYCFLNNVNPDNIIKIDFQFNQLTDISGIRLFKNLEELYLYKNNLKDITLFK